MLVKQLKSKCFYTLFDILDIMDDIEKEIIEKSYSQLISDGFKLYAHNFWKLLLIWLIFTSITIIIDVFIVSYLRSRYYRSISLYIIFSVLGSVIFSIITVFTLCSVSIYLFENYLQKDPNFIDSFKNAYNERLRFPMLIFIIINLIPDVMISLWVGTFFNWKLFTYHFFLYFCNICHCYHDLLHFFNFYV